MWVLSIFLVLLGVIFGLLLNDRINKPLEKMSIYETAKIICLIIPTIMSMIILASLFFSEKVSIEAGGLGIFGILATVWLGLSIYNSIEKNEIEFLKTELKNYNNEQKLELIKLKEQLSNNEKNNFIQLKLSMADLNQNVYEKLFRYNEIINKYPLDYIGYVYRANLYYNINEFGKCIEDCNFILKTNTDALVYNLRGISYSKLKKFNLAIKDFEKSIEFDDKNSSTYFNLGLTYLSLEKPNISMNLFIKAIELNSYNIPAYIELGIYYNSISEYKKAIDILSDGIILDSFNVNLYKHRAFSYRGLEMFDKEKSDLDKIVKINNSNIK